MVSPHYPHLLVFAALHLEVPSLLCFDNDKRKSMFIKAFRLESVLPEGFFLF